MLLEESLLLSFRVCNIAYKSSVEKVYCCNQGMAERSDDGTNKCCVCNEGKPSLIVVTALMIWWIIWIRLRR